jgi:hypothetical protein
VLRATNVRAEVTVIKGSFGRSRNRAVFAADPYRPAPVFSKIEIPRPGL